jgi:hypothetical protein
MLLMAVQIATRTGEFALAKPARETIYTRVDAETRYKAKAFIDTAIAIVLAALLVGYLIYTTDDGVMRKYGTERLYTTVPFVIAGILRYLQIALVEKRSGSPTEIALSDRFIVVCVLGWLAVFGYLIYL